jgi:O-antigen ligase
MILGTGSMMLLAFWAGLALEDRAWRRPIYLWGAVAMGLGLLFTQTRSAWLGLAAGWGLLLAWRKPRWALGALAVVLLAGLALKGSPIMARLHQGVDMGHFATRERVYMAQAGVGIIKDHPLMGVGDSMESWDTPGPDGKSVHMEGYYRRYMSDQARHDPEVGNNEQGHLHDNFIMLTAMLGVPGLLLVLAFFAALVWTALGLVRGADPLARGIGLGYIAVVAAWWTNGVFEFNFCSAQSSATLWFLTGLLLAAVRLAKGKTTPA